MRGSNIEPLFYVSRETYLLSLLINWPQAASILAPFDCLSVASIPFELSVVIQVLIVLLEEAEYLSPSVLL